MDNDFNYCPNIINKIRSMRGTYDDVAETRFLVTISIDWKKIMS